jgi:hypothetical protein
VSFDAGTIVNSDRVRAQLEGAVIFGMSLALYGGITMKGGAIEQDNFRGGGRIVRINEAPRHISVDLVESTAAPGGVGEPGVPPVAPQSRTRCSRSPDNGFASSHYPNRCRSERIARAIGAESIRSNVYRLKQGNCQHAQPDPRSAILRTLDVPPACDQSVGRPSPASRCTGRRARGTNAALLSHPAGRDGKPGRVPSCPRGIQCRAPKYSARRGEGRGVRLQNAQAAPDAAGLHPSGLHPRPQVSRALSPARPG